MKIYIISTGHKFQYDIGDIARIFFSADELEYLDAMPEQCMEGLLLHTGVQDCGSRSLLKVTLRDKGESAGFMQSEIPSDDTLSVNDGEHARAVKRELKRLAYMVLAAYTGKSSPWGVLTGIRPAKIVHELTNKSLGRQEVTGVLTGYYLISPEKAELLWEVASAEEHILKSSSERLIALYIGIPFCTTRCLYCSFTSNPVGRYKKMIRPYMDALLREIEYVSGLVKSRGLGVESIYIGGGTPTSLDADMLHELLQAIEAHFDLSDIKEYTVEAGRPDTLDREKLSVIKNSRVDRISINPQTMNDETLGLIGRNHTAADIVDKFCLARELGFNNINMDIIVGLPGETVDMLENTLKEVARLRPESLTVHTMSVKRASRLNEQKESYSLTGYETVAKMIDLSMQYAKKMEMHPYYLYRQKNILGNLENVGYSRKGYEGIYNVQIMEERQTIIALGAGAITKVVYPGGRIERIFNVKSVEEYITRIDEMLERKNIL